MFWGIDWNIDSILIRKSKGTRNNYYWELRIVMLSDYNGFAMSYLKL